MVLDNHLLNGHGDMTLISFEGGKVVMRDGKVGTEEQCRCCDMCKVVLRTAYSVCWGGAFDPDTLEPITDQEEWSCGINANAFSWLKTALESYGWTVTISDWTPPGGCELVVCAKQLIAECRMCDFDDPGDGAWFSLEEYAEDNPLPEEPPFQGAQQPQQIYIGSAPLTMIGSWPCCVQKGTFEVGINPPYEYPTCNPLP